MDNLRDLPLLDFVGPNTLPDHLFTGANEKGGVNEKGSEGGSANNIGGRERSRFQRKNDYTPSGFNLEDLADYSIHSQCDSDTCIELLNQLHDRYVPENIHGEMLRSKMYELWGLESDMRPNLERVNEEYWRSVFQAYQIYQQLLSNNMIGTRDNESLQNQRKISRIFEVLYLMRDMLMAEQRWTAMCDPTVEVRIPDEVQIFKFCPFDYSNNTPYQNLLIFLLQQAYVRGYRRREDLCFEQIKSSEGYFTHAWKRLCTIREFIHSVVQKESNYEMWKALTTSGDIDRKASAYLEQHDDVEFPKLEIDRHIFSFRNGVLKLGGFKHDSKSMMDELVMPEFHPYDSHPLPDNIASVKYFPEKFNMEEYFRCEDWYDIPTPTVEGLLDDQHLPREAKEMMYIQIGRMNYDVNEYDGWQVIPFIRGVANTGKSSILRAIYSFFPPEFVGVMSSNMEKKFWASSLYNKFAFLCYEARSDFSVPQGEFQSVVSGEEMSVPVKFKTALSLVWKVPGFLAGNEVPNWIDAAGSMTRRLVVWEFNHKIRKTDPRLMSKLRAEIPALLIKSNLAYLWAVNEHGNSPIWEWWGAYFDNTLSRLSAQISPLKAFLENTEVLVQDPNYIIPMEDFQELFYKYCDNSKLKQPKWAENYYRPIFEDEGIAIIRHTAMEYDGETLTHTWLKGVGRRDVFCK